MSTQSDIERLAEIGKRIKALRIKAGFSSHEAFADTHGFQRKQIWRLEKGEGFTMTTLLRIVDIHEINLEEFFKGI